MTWKTNATVAFQHVENNTLNCLHQGFAYTIHCTCGSLILDKEHRMLRIRPTAGGLTLSV